MRRAGLHVGPVAGAAGGAVGVADVDRGGTAGGFRGDASGASGVVTGGDGGCSAGEGAFGFGAVDVVLEADALGRAGVALFLESGQLVGVVVALEADAGPTINS